MPPSLLLKTIERHSLRQERTFLPFLYQTQTILRSQSRSRSRAPPPTLVQSRGRHSQANSRPSTGRPTGLRTIDYEAQADVSPSFDSNTTLTPLEVAKFRRIFEAAARGLPPPSLQKLEHEAEERDYKIGEGLDELFTQYGKRKEVAGEESASTSGEQAQGEGEESKLQLDEATERRRLRAEKRRASDMRFPEVLREAWRDVQRIAAQSTKPKAMRKEEGGEAQASKQKKPQTELAKELEKLRTAEIERVRVLLSEAKDDRKIWEVLDKEVLERVCDLVFTIQHNVKSKVRRDGQDVQDGQDGRRKLSPRQIAVLQGAFSSHLVNGLRALRRTSPRSPYSTALLPTVKQIDPISHVLGSSSELYNELLYDAWRVHANIAECARLAEEMYSQGVDSDRVTQAVFVDAQKEMRAALAGSETVRPARRLWWRLSGVQESMTRWHAAMDLLDGRAEEEQRMAEEWELERNTNLMI